MREAMRRTFGCAIVAAAMLLAGAGQAPAQRATSDSLAHTRPRPAPRWTLGSPAADVRRAQGAPSIVQRLPSLGLELWSYGAASVRLSSDSLRVIGWSDAGRTLRVRLAPGADTTSSRAFGAGATRDDVLRLQGTPTALVAEVGGGATVLMFGRSVVRFDPGGRVATWSDADRVLRTSGPPPESRPVVAAPASRPSAPATLDARVRIETPASDGLLEAGARGSIVVDITNRGPGRASNIRVRATPDSGAQGLVLGESDAISSLDAGATATVRVPVIASADRAAGVARVRVSASEANGFDLEPARRVAIRTAALRPARFELAGTRVDDQSGDGRVSPREVAEITARVWNAGTGEARDVSVRLAPAQGVFLTQESPTVVSLGALAPRAWRDLSFTLYTNSRAQSLAVRLLVSDGTGRWSAELPIELPLDRPVASTLDVPSGPSGPSAPASGGDAEPPALLDVVERDIPRGPRNPDAMAVVLGVERYRDLPPARWAARDAALVRRYLVDALGVSDDRNHIYMRTDADVTGNEFRKLFADDGWLARRVQPTTDLVVYWSGHGAADAATRTPYLLPFDGDANYARATGYSLSTLYEQLARLDVRSVTVIVDACFTGLTRSHATLTPGARPVVVSIEHPALRKQNMAVFAAARGDQTASDYPPRRHGLFTYFVLDGLRGAADADGDRRITVAELERYATRRVRETAGTMDREQTPVVVARDKSRVIARLP